MKTACRFVASLLVVAAMSTSVMAQEEESAISASVNADLASAYVYRGGTINDGLVFQPGAEASFSMLAVGVWANYDIDDYNDTLEQNKFSEVDFYGSLSTELAGIALSLCYTEYTYPDADGGSDRDLCLTASYEWTVTPSIAIYRGLHGSIDEVTYVETALGYDYFSTDDMTLGLSASVGYMDQPEGEDGFCTYLVTQSFSYSLLTASISYVGKIGDDILQDVDDGGSYDTEVYGTVGIAYSL